jgi:hypothetical protein
MGAWVVSTLLFAAQIGGDPALIPGDPATTPPPAQPDPATEAERDAPTPDDPAASTSPPAATGAERPADAAPMPAVPTPPEPAESPDAIDALKASPDPERDAPEAAEAAYRSCLAHLDPDTAAEAPSPAEQAPAPPPLASDGTPPPEPADEPPADTPSPQAVVEACLTQLRTDHPGTPAAERALAVLDAVRIMRASGARLLADTEATTEATTDDDDDDTFIFEPPSFAGRIQLTAVSAAYGLATGIATASIGGVWLPSLPALWVLLGGGLGAALGVGYGVGGFILSGDEWGGSPGAWLAGAGLFAGLSWGGALSTVVTALFATLLPQQILQQTAFQGLATTDIILTGMGGYLGFAAGFALAWLLKLDERQVNIINVTATVGGLASLLVAINWFAPASLFGSGPIALGYLTAAAAASYIVGSVAHTGVGIGLSYVLDYTVAEGVVIAAASLGSAAVVGITTNIAAPLLGLAALGSWAYVPFATLPAAIAAGAGGATAAGVISFLRQAGGEPVLRLDRLKDLGLEDLETFVPAPLMIWDKDMEQTMIAPVIGLRF